ncbi:oxidoreductase : Putative dehydrogenase OS=Singulisphaera acidiphila (strain ATCC BAA-1392 / DSM 18658 / VKM B-2454 / MOB10) GN=Sinac_3719 PE=4 SV=1: GFO_IDH_MocA [Gemmataceae bacterium]|nr:oxidoreductase : Putative dehydrogenase OS=Singulisphaera acidiphila (strain ATCC BAA-1392 / DSM 18658 / VKM B-2454 / MOB10) GN=Sinac_3719 PE=4 SV=1: GFO_IDH_MocA [Gemmataceae bacterium]VTT99317.1 oxidoreductase : Putative dehydrogenase OS=Singulisphaera acidiphila (strain ATCC BAA-1392 / DSM 18658 / VKM B-2454 / MOB10) GN=Sinac_3719 PE=4 SV=1: GFO_IDH_MocA [Gemmataceae bacterium]
MVRIGIVGLGFMGRIHYLASQRLRGAKVAAVCSRDRAKLAGDWRNTRGNFGPEPGHVDLAGIKAYANVVDLLADPEIDLIDICTVTDQHASLAIQALKAGKHVLVEKAIALTTADADAMVAAAKASGKLLMVAHVLPFFPEFKFAAEAIRGGQYGKLVAAHFKRVIAKPDWSADIGDAAKTGGPAVDLHIHDTHFIGLVCGVPKQVFAVGTVEKDAVTYLTTSYLYGPGGPAVTCSSGAVSMGGRPFAHGFEIFLERASLVYNSDGTPLTLLTADGKSSQPALSGGGDPLSAFADEIQAAVDGVASGTEPDLLSGQLARDALVLCHRECESVKTGRAVAVN